MKKPESHERPAGRILRRTLPILLVWAAVGLAVLPKGTHAIPAFARQTGQRCSACHAGGQFPELTSFGRMFKLTGYTIGQHVVPVSVMAVVSASKVSNTSKSPDPGADFQKNGDPIFATASLFLGGKITNKLGGFAQITYDPYAAQYDDGSFHGHTNADNIDVRYADRFEPSGHDLIFGVSANNNPSVSDPWNTAPAWMQYVPVPSPTSSRFIDGNAPYPGYGAGGNIAGLSAYALWDQTVYAELGGYQSADGLFSFMRAGVPDGDVTKLRGINPYWRLAYTHDWGPHSLMLGTSGMVSRVYDDPLDTSDPSTTHRFRDVGIDAQYQYLTDAHSITAQLAYMTDHHDYPASLAGQAVAFVDAHGNALPATSASDSTHVLRGKLTYVYQDRVGGSLGFFDLGGGANSANLSSGYDPATLRFTADPAAGAPSVPVDGNRSGKPDTRGWTLEAFWTPEQHVRLGAQLTMYDLFNGARSNYDGFGRNASDNNTLFLYAWMAY